MPQSIVIIAPHPDDESLGCSGVIQQAIRAGAGVKVIFITNGDGYPASAAALTGKKKAELLPQDFEKLGSERQKNAQKAAAFLGLRDESLCFLAYPDAGLTGVQTDAPCCQPFTRRDRTYGLLFPDYHTQRHGAPAPYCRKSVICDLAEIFMQLRPERIYVTDKADGHADHAAAFDLTRDAAATAGYCGTLHTYLVHGRGGTWPWPAGATPEQCYGAHKENGLLVPAGIPWPPDERIILSKEEIMAKERALCAYELEMKLDAQYFTSFIKSEEIFWCRK